MQYTRLGRSGLIVSRACFGCLTFGSSTALPTTAKVDRENARLLVGQCLDAGVNFFDVADIYSEGQAETLLGDIIRPNRHDIVIATKLGWRSSERIADSGLSRHHILDACHASLKRLGTDYIDLLIVHKEDPFTPLEETLSTLNELVRSGKVRYIGYSNWQSWRAATALQMQKTNGWAPFVCAQLYYSLLGRDIEFESLPFLQYGELGLMAWSPLAGGYLTGKYRAPTTNAENRLSATDTVPFDKRRAGQIVESMLAMAQSLQVSLAQLSLAWVLHRAGVNGLVIGATKAAQLKDNLAAFELHLDAAVVADLDALTATAPPFPTWYAQRAMDPLHVALKC